jgi:hypothetical protein
VKVVSRLVAGVADVVLLPSRSRGMRERRGPAPVSAGAGPPSMLRAGQRWCCLPSARHFRVDVLAVGGVPTVCAGLAVSVLLRAIVFHFGFRLVWTAWRGCWRSAGLGAGSVLSARVGRVLAWASLRRLYWLDSDAPRGDSGSPDGWWTIPL